MMSTGRSEPPLIKTPRLVVRLVEPDDVDEVIAYDRRNAEHVAMWSPARRADAFDRDKRRERLARRRAEADADTGYGFIATLRDDPCIVAGISLDQVIRLAFQASHLGYSVDREHEGKGLASEAVRAVVDFAFETLGLHRIMANYQPTNVRSGRLLRRLGFVPEGYARDYLFINGAWRDHVLTALLNPRPAEEGC
jgi:ribosomal-protein-alanine N-acetyltransferase